MSDHADPAAAPPSFPAGLHPVGSAITRAAAVVAGIALFFLVAVLVNGSMAEDDSNAVYVLPCALLAGTVGLLAVASARHTRRSR